MTRPLPAALVQQVPATGEGVRAAALRQQVTPDAAGILDALPVAVIALDGGNSVTSVNAAGEALIGLSRMQLIARSLAEFVAADSPLFALIEAARNGAGAVAESDMAISGPRISIDHASVDVAPLPVAPRHVCVMLQDRGLEWRLAQQAASRDGARSAKAIAAMLAHEVKNPLSGIRGAAQLLEQKVTAVDRTLTQLICEETDRIVGLVNGLEVFTDPRPGRMQPVNIHEVLDHVRNLAQAGFGRRATFREEYDPSLPAVLGNRDQLVQVFLNLLKNAVEALPGNAGTVTLGTRYRPGLTMSEPGASSRRRLGLVVTVQDNGGGVPDGLKAQLYEPFVSGKTGGKGLGLALVAKIVADHGGMIDCESQPGRTVFSVILPIADDHVEAAA